MKQTVGVMGPSNASSQQLADAFEVGKIVAGRGHVLISGGMSGTMEAACAGAKGAGGLVIGICPVGDERYVNEHVDVAVLTSMGGGRNFMNILSSNVIVAIGCNRSAGTLSEIAFALQMRTPLLVIRPPAAMRTFLSEFQASGRAEFCDDLNYVEPFLDRSFRKLATEKEAARHAMARQGL